MRITKDPGGRHSYPCACGGVQVVQTDVCLTSFPARYGSVCAACPRRGTAYSPAEGVYFTKHDEALGFRPGLVERLVAWLLGWGHDF